MKKITASFLAVFIIMQISVFYSVAKTLPRITSTTIKPIKGEEQIIVINISDNFGLMGFKLHLDYSENDVEILKADKGKITSEGSLSNNIGNKRNSCDILWSNTSNVVGDGSIVLLKVKSLTTSPFKIDVSYSQEDTFDEYWNDVNLLCEAIVTDNYNLETTTDESNSTQPSSLKQLDQEADFIVDDYFDKKDIESLEDIKENEKEKIVKEINDEIFSLTGSKNFYSDYPSLIDDYKEDLKEKLVTDINSLATDKSSKQLIDEKLNEIGVAEISKENVYEIMQHLVEEGLDKKYSKYLTENDLYDILKKVYDEKESITLGETDLAEEQKRYQDKDHGPPLIILIVLFIILIALSIIFTLKFIKERESNNEEK